MIKTYLIYTKTFTAQKKFPRKAAKIKTLQIRAQRNPPQEKKQTSKKKQSKVKGRFLL